MSRRVSAAITFSLCSSFFSVDAFQTDFPNRGGKTRVVPYSSKAIHPQRRILTKTVLYESTTPKEGADVVDVEPEEEDGLTKAYRRGSYLFGTLGATVLLMPDRTGGLLLPTKWGGGAGFGLAAGLSYILAGANDHGRLKSDTYKRLNIGLLGFSLLGLVAVPGEAAFLPSVGGALLLSFILTAARAYGVMISFRGWKRGVVSVDNNNSFGPRRILDELEEGTKSNFKGLKVQDRKKALTYRNLLAVVVMGVFSFLMEGLFNLRYKKALHRNWFDISLQWSGVARLFMISSMIYSLKDAAERDRLTGTTFIQLNLMTGTWALLVGLGQSIYPSGFDLRRGVDMFAFSFPFYLKAVRSQKEKSAKKKAKNEAEEDSPKQEGG